jgi:aminoglycoside/choline kinase family phosphotransferase
MSQKITSRLSLLFKELNGSVPDVVEALPRSGSDRIYFRLKTEGFSVIGAFNADVSENEAFFSFTDAFSAMGVNVPAILKISDCKKYYLLTDLGNETLFELIQNEKGISGEKKSLCYIKEVLKALIKMQVQGAEKIDFSKCYPVGTFDEQAIMWDLNYFKYLFLKPAGIGFNEYLLENDFNALSAYLLKAPANFFMFRDFQSRNIMIKDKQVWFIDYQGGRKGPLQYDVASLLFSPKTGLNKTQREVLLNYYIDELEDEIEIDRYEFTRHYYGFVLIRILQALGAYGFRGIIEQKKGFKSSIPVAVSNLKYLFDKNLIKIDLPEIKNIVEIISRSEWACVFAPNPNKLTVRVSSFSYKNGIPPDPSENGGGFVFDCRGLPNPGRLEKYRSFNGTEKIIIDYLEQYREVAEFQKYARQIVSISINEYIERGFDHLCVNFGCTGGQHRSVYNAEVFSHWVENNFPVNVVLVHKQIQIIKNGQNQV